MSQVLYLNGDFMPLSEGRVSVLDRGFQFADGVYEVIRVYNGKPFCLNWHLERMQNSMRRIDMEPPLSVEEMGGICREVVRRSGALECALYGQITRGAAPRNHKYPGPDTPPTIIFYNHPVVYAEAAQRRQGVRLITHPDERWKMCDVKSIALLMSVLLKNRALKQGAADTMLYDNEGFVTEGGSSNLYCIKDGTLYTAPDGPRILTGITKVVVLEEARAMGMPVVEDFQTVDFFKSADEVFLSSTTVELMPVIQVDDVAIGRGEAGPLTWALHEAYQRRIERECRSADAAAV